ncbi:hypothetical protein CEC48_04410 [Pseudomonas sp. K2I15]|nr:hypothetical protein CEC48_04410 [Pseudomonas sp. K2I15]
MYDQNFTRTNLSVRSISRKADDLAYYKNALDTLEIDFKADERFKTNRPTYAFLSLLNQRVSLGELAESSASRIVSTIVEFYRWLEFQFRLQRMYPLWEEFTRTRSTVDDKGVTVVTTYTTTDLAETIKKARSPRDPNHIVDEGKLKPLTEEQQTETVKALYDSKNTEMILGFLMALSSSARIQTAFTLRARSFARELPTHQEFFRIHTGKGTGVDTKRGKKHYLDVPAWLYKKIYVYLRSDRYLARAKICQLPESEKYIFYTSRGNPYYTSTDDATSASKEGSAVRVFMTEQLFPRIARLGHSFRFRFHDLRATYCLNRLDEGLQSVERGEATLDGVLRGIQDAMGHSDIRTTYRYLDYRNLNPVINTVNKAWTAKLLSDIVKALDKDCEIN